MIYYSIYNSLKKKSHTCQLLFCAVYDVACTCYHTFVLAVSRVTERNAFPAWCRGIVQKSYGGGRRSRLTRVRQSFSRSDKRESSALACCGLFYAKLVKWLVQSHQSASTARQMGVSDYGVLSVPLGFMVWEELVLIWFARSSLLALCEDFLTFKCSLVAVSASHQGRDRWTKNCLPQSGRWNGRHCVPRKATLQGQWAGR